jgi:drug/metabolite transporter (DMT)-like permease
MTDIFGSWFTFPYLGEALSFMSAILWASSVVLFRIIGLKVHALGLSLFKNLLSALLLGLTLISFGMPLLPSISSAHYGLLILSGILGLALSDTLFFMALRILGAELTAIVDCAYAPFVIGLSFLFLGERMNGLQTVGVVLIMLAVFLITRKKIGVEIPRRILLSGVILGVSSMFVTAAGIVMIKPMLKQTSLLWASFLRMAAGAVSVGIFLAFYRKRDAILAPLRNRRNMSRLIAPSFLGAYLSQVIWMGGMKYTQASIASALNQLNTVFIFVLGAVFLKERITPLKLAAAVLAFAGALLVSFSL